VIAIARLFDKSLSSKPGYDFVQNPEQYLNDVRCLDCLSRLFYYSAMSYYCVLIYTNSTNRCLDIVVDEVRSSDRKFELEQVLSTSENFSRRCYY